MKNNLTNGGIGFMGLLTLLFIGLKLTNYISWSWWWILSPIWISASIGIFILLLLLTTILTIILVKN